MKAHHLYILLHWGFIAMACEKSEGPSSLNNHPDYFLSGYILDEVTSAPISGAEVFILEKEGGILVQTPDKQIAFTKTDGKGYYEIKFPVRAAGYLYLFQARAQHKNYFTKPNPERITIATSGKSSLDWKLDPPAWIEIGASRTTQASYINYQGSFISGSFSSTNIDSTYLFQVNASENVEITVFKYHSNKDSNSINTYNLGSLPPFDTTSYTINF